MAQEPSGTISINDTGATATSISFSAPALPSSVDGFVVLRTQFGGPIFPVDGQLYTTGMVNGTTTIAYSGNGTTFTDTGLLPGTQYNYMVVLYNGTGSYINYSNSNTNLSSSTLRAEPTTQPNTLTFPTKDENSISAQWNAGGGSEDGYLLIYKAGASPTNGAPVDGTSYNVGQSLGGGTVGLLNSFPNVNLNSLIPNTQYFFDIYSYSYTPEQNYYNYQQLNPLEGSVFTLATQPSTPGGFSFNVTTNTSFNISFSGSASNYLVLRRPSFSPDVDPVDATTYVVGSALGSATVVYNGSTTSFVDSGLTPGTLYVYKVFGYNGTATSSNYSFNAAQSSRFTAPANPVANTGSSIAQTSFTASWDTPVTATSYRLDVSIDPAFGSFVGVYNNLSVGTNSSSVTGLTQGITYYYRVRAVSSTGTSGNSNVATVLTAPPDPGGNRRNIAGTNVFHRKLECLIYRYIVLPRRIVEQYVLFICSSECCCWKCFDLQREYVADRRHSLLL
ncbi:MAG: fibronectin type III domain-containing protein [Bacteroidota bacterium]